MKDETNNFFLKNSFPITDVAIDEYTLKNCCNCFNYRLRIHLLFSIYFKHGTRENEGENNA